MRNVNRQLNIWMSLLMLTLAWSLAGCTRHTVEVQPIRVEPIHLTIDVNVRVDRELDEFFDYERRVPPPADAGDVAPDPVPPAAPLEPAITPGSGGPTLGGGSL